MAKLEWGINFEALGEELAKHDFVKVVRCKDCKWYDFKKEYCLMNGYEPDGSWFCADGERKEKNDESN